MFILIMLIIICFVISGFYFSLRLLKPFSKTFQGRRQLIKGLAVLMLVSAIGYIIVTYVVNNQPDYFKQGIEQLRENKYVKDKIDGFSSYSYKANGLPESAGNIAIFQVELNGDSLCLFLTCTMRKANDSWKLVKINQDSAKKSSQ